MIWLIAIGSSLYSLGLVMVGFWLRGILSRRDHQGTPELLSKDTKTQVAHSQKTLQDSPASGALKSMSPLERSLEDSQEIRERINHLLE